MPGLAHLYVGEEAVAVGICEALQPRITSQARTGPRSLRCQRRSTGSHVCELLGKKQGIARQRRINAHCRSCDRQPWSECNCGVSAGIARSGTSSKRLGTGQVAVAFGEGRLTGRAYEVMNLAALWKLP